MRLNTNWSRIDVRRGEQAQQTLRIVGLSATP